MRAYHGTSTAVISAGEYRLLPPSETGRLQAWSDCAGRAGGVDRGEEMMKCLAKLQKRGLVADSFVLSVETDGPWLQIDFATPDGAGADSHSVEWFGPHGHARPSEWCPGPRFRIVRCHFGWTIAKEDLPNVLWWATKALRHQALAEQGLAAG